MMMGSWMGSDITNDDIVKEYRYSEDFSYTSIDKGKEVLITLTPKKQTISIWGKIELFLDKETQLPNKEYYYDEGGKKIREMKFSDIRTVKNRKIPFKMELTPLNKEGYRTIIRYKKLEINRAKILSAHNSTDALTCVRSE